MDKACSCGETHQLKPYQHFVPVEGKPDYWTLETSHICDPCYQAYQSRTGHKGAPNGALEV